MTSVPQLFARLGAGLEGSALVAVVAALAWGVLSVLLSPCHLATIPLVVAYVGGLGPETKRARALAIAWSFAGGMFAALGVVGLVVVSLGHALEGVRAYASYAIAVVLLAAGLHLLGLIPIPVSGVRLGPGTRKGVLGALGAGLFLGIGLSPCTFAFLAPVIGAAFGAAAASTPRAVALLGAFAVGHCLVVGAAGSSAAFARRFVAWNDASRASRLFKVTCGALLVVGAAALIYGA